MKEKIDVTRPVPFLKPGNPYRLLNTVCRGPTPHAAARVLIRHLKRAVELLTHNPHPTDFADLLGHQAEAPSCGDGLRAPPRVRRSSQAMLSACSYWRRRFTVDR